MKRTLVYAGVGVLFAIVVVAGLRELARARTFQVFGPLVAHVDTPDRRVALSFDDGPTSKLVDSLARVLAARSVRATFFVIGADLAAAPQAGRLLAAAGHELGNHTFSHPHMVLHSPGFIRSQIDRTDSLIRAVGVSRRDFLSAALRIQAVPAAVASGAHESNDCHVGSRPRLVSGSLGNSRWNCPPRCGAVRPGSIILLHPWYESRATSLAAVGPLIDSLQARGYTVGTVGDLMRHR